VDGPAARKVETMIDSLINNLVNLANHKVSLALDRVRNVFVIDTLMNFTLHHGRARVIFDITFPSGLRHLEVLGEALLSEVLDGVIIRIGHEILKANCLGVGFQTVHESCTVTFYLFRRGNG